jgi:hypothetical protein
MARRILNLNLTAAVVLSIAFFVEFLTSPGFAQDKPVGCSKKPSSNAKLGPLHAAKARALTESYDLVDAAKRDSQILKLESLGQWAEARKLMDASGDIDGQVRAAAKLMSEGKTERAYEMLHDKVVSYDGVRFYCGQFGKSLHMMKETLKNIEKERSKSGVAK